MHVADIHIFIQRGHYFLEMYGDVVRGSIVAHEVVFITWRDMAINMA